SDLGGGRQSGEDQRAPRCPGGRQPAGRAGLHPGCAARARTLPARGPFGGDRNPRPVALAQGRSLAASLSAASPGTRDSPMSRLLVLTTVLLLAACTSGLQRNTPPTQPYILRATASPAPVDHPPANRTLQLARVTTDPGLDSDRIVIVQTDHRMGYYALSRWPD